MSATTGSLRGLAAALLAAVVSFCIYSAWCEHHQGQAERLRATLEALIARHEERARALGG